MITTLLAGLLLTPPASAQGAVTGYMEGVPDNIYVAPPPTCEEVVVAGGITVAVVAVVYFAPVILSAAGGLTSASVVEISALASGMGLTVGEIIVLEETVLGPTLDACIDTIADVVMDETEEILNGGGETPDLPPTGGQPNPGGCTHPWEGLTGLLIADPTSPDGLGVFGFDPEAELPTDARSLGIVITVDCEGNVIPYNRVK